MMSVPNIPNINPKIHLRDKDVKNLLLASIAMEELALSHILNAEGEKIQKALENNPTIKEMIEINNSVSKVLRGVIKKEMLLLFKMEDILDDFHDDGDEE